MGHKILAHKSLVYLVLKADAWEETEDPEIRMQIVKDPYMTEENAQCYLGEPENMFEDIDEFWRSMYRQVASDMYQHLLTRVCTYNGYAEVYIKWDENFTKSYSIDDKEFPAKIVDIPITLIQDHNEKKIEENLKKIEDNK